MLTILVLGIIFTTITIGIMSLSFQLLRKRPTFKNKLNNRTANKTMLQLVIITYLAGIVLTLYLMATYQQ